MTMPTSAGASNLIERAKNILMKPQAEFEVIAGEPADVGKLYIGYALPLLLLGAVCSFIGLCLVGVPFIGRLPITLGLELAIMRVVTGLIGLYLMAFVVNALAPNFGSQADIGQAHKLAVYSSTAALLAGVFSILPMLSILALVGLYSFALLYIGLPRLMKTPEEKRMTYFVSIIGVCIVIGVILSVVMSTFGRMLGYNPAAMMGGLG